MTGGPEGPHYIRSDFFLLQTSGGVRLTVAPRRDADHARRQAMTARQRGPLLREQCDEALRDVTVADENKVQRHPNCGSRNADCGLIAD